MTLKIIFAGTPEFAAEILNQLIKSPHEIVAVLTQPDRPKGRGQTLMMSPVKQIALHHHLPVHTPHTLRDAEIQKTLWAYHADIMIVAAYGLILPQAVLTIPRLGCVNVHASLLPHWRGASPIQHAILNGDPITGVTLMKMDEGLDTGDILSLHPCAIEPNETSGSLQQRLARLGAEKIIPALSDLENARIKPIPQDHSRATNAPKITKDAGYLNWQETADALHRKIRAYNPWPMAYTQVQNLRVRILSAEVVEDPTQAPPGTILQSNPKGILVATGEGSLRLLTLQLAGGKPLKVADILNSKSQLFQVGNRLG